MSQPHTTSAARTPVAQIATLEARAERVATPCGAGDLVWRCWRPDAANTDATARPLVLLHGGSGSWTHWFKVIPALCAHRSVWAVDLPGLGDSAMPPAPLTPATSGRIIADGVRALFGENQIDLVAFSFGAHVGTYAAVDLGGQLASFTITGAAAMGLPHPELDFPKESPRMSEAERAALHRRTLAMLMFKDPTRIDDLAIYIQSENIARARFRSRVFAVTDDIPRLLPRVTAPINAIWGADDCLALPDLATRYAVLRADHPELATRTIADAGHWAMYEQADAFAAALSDLLNSRP